VRDWDAATYDRVSDPQVEWARSVLGRLPLRGDETVLDAGCGSGRVTRMLLERLPEGRVIAVDSSPSMVEYHVERLPEHLRDDYVQAVEDRSGEVVLNYVRLNMEARKP
jgi:trans-aconitate methyltransferase